MGGKIKGFVKFFYFSLEIFFICKNKKFKKNGKREIIPEKGQHQDQPHGNLSEKNAWQGKNQSFLFFKFSVILFVSKKKDEGKKKKQ